MKNKTLRLLVVLITALVVFLQMLTNAPEAAAAPRMQYYPRMMFRSAHSQKCLDVTNWSTTPGIAIQQWTCTSVTNAAANQQWQIMGTDSGYFVLRSYYNGLCLDASGGGTLNGTPIIQYGCHMGPNQQFKVEISPYGNNMLVNRKSGRCLDLKAASLENGAAIQLWDCWKWPPAWQQNQLWWMDTTAQG